MQLKHILILTILLSFIIGCGGVNYAEEYEKFRNFNGHFSNSRMWVSMAEDEGLEIEPNYCFYNSLDFMLSPRGDLSNYDDLIAMKEEDCNKLYKEFDEIKFPKDLRFEVETYLFLTSLYLVNLERYDKAIKKNTSILRKSPEMRKLFEKRYLEFPEDLESTLEFYGLDSFEEFWQQQILDLDYVERYEREELEEGVPEELRLYLTDFFFLEKKLRGQIIMTSAVIWTNMLDLNTETSEGRRDRRGE